MTPPGRALALARTVVYALAPVDIDWNYQAVRVPRGPIAILLAGAVLLGEHW